jgi:hypothetical protein
MKRTISIILVLVMICCFVPSAFAAGTAEETAAATLYDLGLFSGTGTDAAGNPEFNLGSVPTRAQAVTMLVGLLGKTQAAESGTYTTPFKDVPAWAQKYVGYAYENGLTSGISKDAFGSNLPVTAQQYLTFVLGALGYDSGSDFSWKDASKLADKLGLTSGEYASAAEFLRGDLAKISASALTQKFKGTDVDLSQIIALSKSITAQSGTDIPVDEIAAIAQSVIAKNGELSSEDITAIAKLVAAEYDTGLPVESIAGIASTLIESKGSDIPTAEIASAASSIAGNYGVDISAEQASAIASLIEGFINK